MKRIVFVLGLVLLTSLVFADYYTGPNGDPLGNPNMYRLGQLAQHRLLIQTQLKAREQYGPQAGEPADSEAREAPARVQQRSGDCISDCDGEPLQTRDQEQIQEQLKDGSCSDPCDGTQERTRTGRPQ